MARVMIQTILRSMWRSRKATTLCGATLFVSLITAILPLRLSPEANPWSNSFLALQLLMFAGFALTISIPNHARDGFLWNQRRIGPLILANERLVLIQLTGESLGAIFIWSIVVLLQSCLLAVLLKAGIPTDFLLLSILTLAAGIALLAWTQPIASLLPTPAAMLIIVCILVLSHFLLGLQAQEGAVYVTGLSLGVEFIAYSNASQLGWPHCGMISLLLLTSVGIANLLSAWILESYQGSLCLLDQRQRRS